MSSFLETGEAGAQRRVDEFIAQGGKKIIAPIIFTTDDDRIALLRNPSNQRLIVPNQTYVVPRESGSNESDQRFTPYRIGAAMLKHTFLAPRDIFDKKEAYFLGLFKSKTDEDRNPLAITPLLFEFDCAVTDPSIMGSEALTSGKTPYSQLLWPTLDEVEKITATRASDSDPLDGSVWMAHGLAEILRYYIDNDTHVEALV